jgi:hypothetical protein
MGLLNSPGGAVGGDPPMPTLPAAPEEPEEPEEPAIPDLPAADGGPLPPSLIPAVPAAVPPLDAELFVPALPPLVGFGGLPPTAEPALAGGGLVLVLPPLLGPGPELLPAAPGVLGLPAVGPDGSRVASPEPPEEPHAAPLTKAIGAARRHSSSALVREVSRFISLYASCFNASQ